MKKKSEFQKFIDRVKESFKDAEDEEEEKPIIKIKDSPEKDLGKNILDSIITFGVGAWFLIIPMMIAVSMQTGTYTEFRNNSVGNLTQASGIVFDVFNRNFQEHPFVIKIFIVLPIIGIALMIIFILRDIYFYIRDKRKGGKKK